MKTTPIPHGQTYQDDAPAAQLTRMLMSSDGTTTSLLESYLDETLRVEVPPQRKALTSELTDWPEDVPSSEVLVRHAALVGTRTGRVVVDARSLIALDHFPERVRGEIRDGQELLGRTLQRHRVEQYREILTSGHERLPWVTYDVNSTESRWRTLVIVVGGRPAALVTECFHLDHARTVEQRR